MSMVSSPQGSDVRHKTGDTEQPAGDVLLLRRVGLCDCQHKPETQCAASDKQTLTPTWHLLHVAHRRECDRSDQTVHLHVLPRVLIAVEYVERLLQETRGDLRAVVHLAVEQEQPEGLA